MIATSIAVRTSSSVSSLCKRALGSDYDNLVSASSSIIKSLLQGPCQILSISHPGRLKQT